MGKRDKVLGSNIISKHFAPILFYSNFPANLLPFLVLTFFLPSGIMPLHNENECHFNTTKAGGYDQRTKRSQTQMSFFIDEQAKMVLDKPKKPKVE